MLCDYKELSGHTVFQDGVEIPAFSSYLTNSIRDSVTVGAPSFFTIKMLRGGVGH